MAVKRIARTIDEIPVRRVEGGDALVDRANAELGRSVFKRAMTGVELSNAYDELSIDDRKIADLAFEITDKEMSELMDEVYRIREDSNVANKETHHDSKLNSLVVILSLLMGVVGLSIASVAYAVMLNGNEVQHGIVLDTVRYFVHAANDRLP
jgi:hypothetical protein